MLSPDPSDSPASRFYLLFSFPKSRSTSRAQLKPGTPVTFVWGEEGGGSKKPTVESHKQVQIRAIVCPVPYVASVRTGYADGGWRATGKL